MPEWVSTLLALTRPVLPAGFYGSIEINVQDGGITNVNVKQSYREGKGT